MIGNPLVQKSQFCTKLSSSFIVVSQNSKEFFLNLQPVPRIKRTQVRSFSTLNTSNENKRNPFSVVLDVPRNILRQTLRPLSDFGYHGRTVWEGGVGLFIVSGAVIFALTLAWLRGFQMRSRFRKYQTVFEFSQACGICTGTPVRIRGVTVGNIIRVNPSLKNVEAVAEIEDDKIIIPKNSLIEANQSGLLMETMIDITPRDPTPKPSAGPLDSECAKQGFIVCDRQKIKGYEGTNLDELVGICTRLGREMEEIGVANTFLLAERVIAVIEEAKPLLTKINTMAGDLQPLLTEIRESGLLQEIENLTRSLTQASEDLRRVQSSVMTPETTQLVQNSVHSLFLTLKNIQNLSCDVVGFTGDEATRRNLKSIVRSLSRLL